MVADFDNMFQLTFKSIDKRGDGIGRDLFDNTAPFLLDSAWLRMRSADSNC
jgi:hypothetical protein